MRLKEIPDDDSDLVPSSLRLKEDTKVELDQLKEVYGKSKVNRWLRQIVENAVEIEIKEKPEDLDL